MSDKVKKWEKDYYDTYRELVMYSDRYNVAYNSFEELVKYIKFMPNTQQISVEIL